MFVGLILTLTKYTQPYQERRSPTSNTPENKMKESLEVVVQIFSELLTKGQSHTELVLESFVKMNIKSNHDLHLALNDTRNSPQLVEIFMKKFKKESGGLHLLHREGSFFRYASM